MAWEIQWQQGIMSDHMGRKYRIALNSRGRQDKVYVQDTNAPKGYTVPIPVEPKPRPRLKGLMKTGSSTTRRLHVYEGRLRGSKWKFVQVVEKSEIVRFAYDNPQDHKELLAFNQLFSRSPDCGATWVPIEDLHTDWHVCYHLDEEAAV